MWPFRRVFYNSCPYHIQINIYQAPYEVFIWFNSNSMIPIFPKAPFLFFLRLNSWAVLPATSCILLGSIPFPLSKTSRWIWFEVTTKFKIHSPKRFFVSKSQWIHLWRSFTNLRRNSCLWQRRVICKHIQEYNVYLLLAYLNESLKRTILPMKGAF